MAIPQDFVYQRYEEASTYTILTSDLKLTADLIDPTKNCVIYADVLTLDESRGKIVFPGRDLTICCRSLDPNGVAISTQSPDSQKAAPAAKPRTSDDPAVNKGNPNGADADAITSEDYGGRGGNVVILAGSIEKPLTVNSSGGKGRAGQKGGDAGRGANGANGGDDREKRQGHFGQPDGKYPGSAGGNGQNGGNGGKGGRPGQGGDAGTITVSTITDPPKVTSTAVGGLAGQPGAGGSGAVGGTGGTGGRYGEWKQTWQGHFRRDEFVYTGRYANGTNGATGSNGQVMQGQNGAGAAVSVRKMASVQAAIAVNAQLFAQLQLMMQVVKMHYLDKDYARAKNVLAWIFGLTGGRSSGAGGKKWDGLHKQAATYLTRLARGLDYFGNAANFVPLASFALYSSSVTQMLILGGTVQTVFDTYTQYLKGQSSSYNDFVAAYSAGTRAIETYKDMIADSKAQRDKLWDECLALESQVAAAKSRMLAAEQPFRLAVEARRKCLKFEAIVDLITALTGFPADILGVMKSAKGASMSGAAESLVGGLPANFLGLGKTINVLSSDFSDTEEQWKKTVEALAADGADSAKLAGDLDAINEQMAEYMDMPEARAYNAAVRAYVGLCQARNLKIMECSKLDEDMLGLDAQIDQTQTQMDELKSVESGKLDPKLAPYRTFLLGLYNNYKDSLLDQLFYETMAYRYRTLQDFGKIIQSGNTIAELSVMQGQILQAVIDHQNGVSAIEQPFNSLPTNPMEGATSESVASFLAGGDLVFRIPFGEPSFQGLAQLQMTKFTVSLPGVQFASSQQQRKVYVSLRCHGDCAVVDPKSETNIFRFTHNPITTTYQYELVQGADGKDVERYIAGGALVDTGDGHDQKSISLSPFCMWTMSLPAKFNVGVDVSQVKNVVLSFGGKGLPAASTKATYHATMI